MRRNIRLKVIRKNFYVSETLIVRYTCSAFSFWFIANNMPNCTRIQTCLMSLEPAVAAPSLRLCAYFYFHGVTIPFLRHPRPCFLFRYNRKQQNGTECRSLFVCWRKSGLRKICIWFFRFLPITISVCSCKHVDRPTLNLIWCRRIDAE